MQRHKRQCVSEVRTSLLFTLASVNWSSEQGVRGAAPMPLSEVKKWSETHQLYFTCLLEQRQWWVPSVWLKKGWNGQDMSAHMRALHLQAQCNSSLGDHVVLGGQRTKPESSLSLEGTNGWPTFPGPLGQILHLNNAIVTTAAKV